MERPHAQTKAFPRKCSGAVRIQAVLSQSGVKGRRKMATMGKEPEGAPYEIVAMEVVEEGVTFLWHVQTPATSSTHRSLTNWDR
jgi:hypothetical protein